MQVGRHLLEATLLSDGKVPVSGWTTTDHASASTEIYDPVANTFTLAADMTEARYFYTATRLANGHVLGGDRGLWRRRRGGERGDLRRPARLRGGLELRP